MLKRILRRYTEWNSDWNVDIALRYYPIIKALKGKFIQRMLEIGSGGFGIARFMPDIPLTVSDIRFPYSINGLRQVQGTATALPFRSGYFDIVLSVDMLEHISPSDRRLVLSEMLRVVRPGGFLIIAVPCGSKAEESDYKVNSFHHLVTGEEHRWLREHVEYGLPKREDILAAIESYPCIEKITMQNNVNLFMWRSLHRLLAFRFVDLLHRLIFQPIFPLLRMVNAKNPYRLIFYIEKASEDG